MLAAEEKRIDQQPDHRLVNHHRLEEANRLAGQPLDARLQWEMLALRTL